MYATTDKKVEDIMPPAMHRTDGRGIKTKIRLLLFPEHRVFIRVHHKLFCRHTDEDMKQAGVAADVRCEQCHA